MRNYEARMKAIERKLPKGQAGDAEIWISHEDGTITGPGGRTITHEQFEREAAEKGEEIISMGGYETEEERLEDEERTRRWHENRKRWGLE